VPIPRGLPVVDHHCHLSPRGEGVAAAARFRAVGGTHLFLATQNYAAEPPRTLDGYREQFETTDLLARRVHQETGVVVYSVLAPYPLDLIGASSVLGLGAAAALQRSALDLAGEWVREKRAVALGEVGRAHFPVPADISLALDETFRHALHVAHDVGCPVVVHSADLGPADFRSLAEEAQQAGVPPGRVVKHYARRRVPGGEAAGIVPSYLARRELVSEVARDPGPWFLETDFLDDPARPGAVLDLATVPRRARSIAERSSEDADRLWTPFVESVERVYGWRPEAGPEAGP
jgi:TatD-related deoxyribonuclease